MCKENDIQFRVVPEEAIELLGIAPTLECSKCRSIIRRGQEYAYFYLSDYVTVKWCIRCWPGTRIELKKLRAKHPDLISADGVLREMVRVKRRYEEIKGAGTWPGAGEA